MDEINDCEPETDNKIKKRHKRTKNELYVKEQHEIFLKLCGILEITEKQNSFTETMVTNKEDKIKALCEEIKKYYPAKVWFRSSCDVKTHTIAKQIFVHHGYDVVAKNITLKKLDVEGKKIKEKKFFISQNE